MFYKDFELLFLNWLQPLFTHFAIHFWLFASSNSLLNLSFDVNFTSNNKQNVWTAF